MKKQEMIERLAAKTTASEEACRQMLGALCDIFTDELCAGGKVPLTGIGSFVVKDSPARMSRNPQTGEPVHVPAFRRVYFRPSNILKAALKGKGDHQLRELGSRSSFFEKEGDNV